MILYPKRTVFVPPTKNVKIASVCHKVDLIMISPIHLISHILICAQVATVTIHRPTLTVSAPQMKSARIANVCPKVGSQRDE